MASRRRFPTTNSRASECSLAASCNSIPVRVIHEGMMVEVVQGRSAGVVGRLLRKDAPTARLVLSVDLIGQAVSVEVDAASVKAY